MRSHRCLAAVVVVAFRVLGQEVDLQAPVQAPVQAEVQAESDPAFARLANPGFPSPEVRSVPIDRGPKIERADLSPYFTEGKLAEAHAAFEAGSYSKSIALMEGLAETGPARFLRALAAHRIGDWKFSSQAFEALAQSYAPLRDRCLVHAGWGYEQLRDWRGAVRVFEQVGKTSRLTPDARLGLARAHRWLGDLKRSQELIADYLARPSPPWGRDVGAESLLVLADLMAAKKDAKAEQAALLKLWSGHPMSREANKAEPRLGDLTKLPQETLVARAESLIDAHRNLQGIAIVEPMIATLKLPEPLACRAQFALGKGYRKQRQHAKAVAMLAPLKKCKDPELRARAMFTLAFSQSITAPALAADTYESLARASPEHALADDALFFAADMRLRRGERAQAMDRLLDVVDRYPTGDFAADALFKLFWVARSEGRLDEAVIYLTEIEGRWARSEDPYELERAGYWRGRVLEEQGKNDEALALLERLAVQHPATYYGLLSRERVLLQSPERGAALNTSVTAAPVAGDPFPIHAGPLGTDPQFASAVELLRLGFGELVPMEILAIDRTALPLDSLRLMVLVLSMAGEERSAHGLARLWLRRDLSGPITSDRRAIWEIAYPNVFRELVVTHSRSADGLDPDLLQALMREESALDPRALSWAGARGLCQLMPATASGVAMQLKLKQPGQAQLLEPELNIQLGARYLSDLVIRLKGVKPFALASYNAGESAVARWRRENGDADLPSWVELVPLQETRGYVKRVLRSYNTYKLLYAPGESARSVAPLPVKPPVVSKRAVPKRG